MRELSVLRQSLQSAYGVGGTSVSFTMVFAVAEYQGEMRELLISRWHLQ